MMTCCWAVLSNDVISGDLGSFLFGSDTITGGAGDDIMMGGAGADVFVFAQNDGQDVIGALAINHATPGISTVTGADFESGVDQLDVSVLGYASAADAFALVSDVGGVATFSDQGTEITFAGLTRVDLDQNDFIIA
ncbi:hypothetical protein QTO30_00960 [Yoonia sp. GPGPB17]|uniref:hypothetical protein n=1 Tax=Yoonia sp. GPGPB17 TaxID=3026147 RepID=UPI0030BC15B4